LLGLLAAGEAGSEEVRAGIDYLLATQQADGTWQEEQFTGTGFPKVFYLKYHMYPLYFPLMALARYASAVGARRPAPGSRQGTGRIREYKQTIKEKLTVDECLASVDECGAPIVSICGGEPMIYPELGELVRGILRRRKHIYLCTNGMFIEKRLHEFRPTSRFFFNVHLDGLEKTHDMAVEREGVFRAAVEGIKAAKKAGFLVCTNTTVYKETDITEIDALFAFLTRLGVDGFMLSPAYGYTAVQETNPEGAAQIFLTRDDIRAKFREAEKLFKKYR